MIKLKFNSFGFNLFKNSALKLKLKSSMKKLFENQQFNLARRIVNIANTDKTLGVNLLKSFLFVLFRYPVSEIMLRT